MPRLQRAAVVSLTLLLCIGFDQATKAVASATLPGREVISLAGDLVRIQYAENAGAFLSLGAGLPEQSRALIFTLGVAAIVAVLLVYLLAATTLTPLMTVALSLVCAGGIGNLIDRVVTGGYVIDFLNMGIGGLRTGIFNVADMALMAGLFLVVIESGRAEQKEA